VAKKGTPKKIECGLHQFTESPPDWLSKDAKVIWLRSASALAAKGILKPLYKVWFETFCCVYARVQELRRNMARAATTDAERAYHAEQLEEWQPLLIAYLSEMDFTSESEFERFLQTNIQ
jgi:phage terminase small subunit